MVTGTWLFTVAEHHVMSPQDDGFIVFVTIDSGMVYREKDSISPLQEYRQLQSLRSRP